MSFTDLSKKAEYMKAASHLRVISNFYDDSNSVRFIPVYSVRFGDDVAKILACDRTFFSGFDLEIIEPSLALDVFGVMRDSSTVAAYQFPGVVYRNSNGVVLPSLDYFQNFSREMNVGGDSFLDERGELFTARLFYVAHTKFLRLFQGPDSGRI